MAVCDPWPVSWQCDIDCLAPAVTGQAVAVASEILYALSGRQFGTCTRTIRPCRRACTDQWTSAWGGYMYPLPALIGGQWFNLTCGRCSHSCSCTGISEVDLGGYVQSVTEVKVGGAPLVTGAYRVDDNHWLVRTDGGEWPWCQDLGKPATQPGTWSVTAVYGQPVPAAGQVAAGELACQLAKALNDEACQLPRAITSLARQGVTMTYAEIANTMAGGYTGLYLVDQFLQAYNPYHLAAAASVYNIDAPPPRATTWGAV